MSALIHGFLLALALILPIGPQNMFVLTRGAQARRLREALPAVLTASLADTLLISVAVGGVGLLLLSLPALSRALTLLGVLYIAYIGYRFWRSSGENTGTDEAPAPNGRSDVAQTLSVSLLNPHAILDTVGIIGAASAQYLLLADRMSFAIGAALVSWVWFLALALLGRVLGTAVAGERLQLYMPRVSALLMWAIAMRMSLGLLGH